MENFENTDNFDDDLEDVFGTNSETLDQTTSEELTTDAGNDTDDTEEEYPEDISDEEMENVFKPAKKSKKKDSTKDSTVTNVDKNEQQPQRNNTGPQDLVDKDGNVIAKAGAERRIFEENQKLRKDMAQFHAQVLPAIKQQYQAMEQELANYKGVVEGMHAQDLSPQDIQSGFDFVRQWKKNPKEVVKFLLTSLQQSGIDIDIEGMSGAIQTSAIKNMLDERLKPFEEERDNARRIAQQEQEVEQEYNFFVQKYPDSVVHDKTLAFMVRNDPNLSPELAYYKLKNYYLQKGLDFSKPLEEIVKEKATVPVGIPQPPVVNDTVAVNKVQQRVARASDSFKDIIKGAMQESGL